MRQKQVILTLLISFTASMVLAQTLTANELLTKSKCNSFDCFNDFLISKKISLGKSGKAENFEYYFYLSDKKFTAQSNSKVVIPNRVGVIIYSDGTLNRFDITITSSSNYQTLKKSFLTELGFVSQGTFNQEDDTAESNIYTNYFSKKHPNVELRINTIVRESEGEEWTEYAFEIIRKNK